MEDGIETVSVPGDDLYIPSLVLGAIHPDFDMNPRTLDPETIYRICITVHNTQQDLFFTSPSAVTWPRMALQRRSTHQRGRTGGPEDT
jgi:hypothetical protein